MNDFSVADSIDAVPSDTVDMPVTFSGFIVHGEAGSVKVSFKNDIVPARTYAIIGNGIPVFTRDDAIRVWDTGTTATGVVVFVNRQAANLAP